MKFLALLPFLLTLGAAEDVADVAAAGDVTIFDAKDYRGQNRAIPVNGICQDLSPPFSTAGRGIRSIRFDAPQGENCEVYLSYQCRGNYAEVVFESRASTYIQAYSIRCSKN
ncbi:hypothetical protein MY5147_004642 [Beauveria neobassiana]|uniref:Uncharacterized protein n=2 Tax=Beauveria bassiana TaxID=176275 RepID=J4KME2_BEAB2|nr:uncharacterized protein BBA_07123 [Beauveria bassiana ARSEF 2860]EJP63799.1 hypothetical protein BBA_07123 [Beauveria bassiana ARSEF 2860]KGQ03514.1 hypothetical protein BBAD15_g11269 [Beauveria bassiana D1-5]